MTGSRCHHPSGMRCCLLLCAIAIWSSAVAWPLAPRLPRLPRTLLSAKGSGGQPASTDNTLDNIQRPKRRTAKKQAPKGKASPGPKSVGPSTKPKRKRRPKRKPPPDLVHPDVEQFLVWMENGGMWGAEGGGGAFELYHFLEEHIIDGGAEVSVFVYNHIIEASVREGSLHVRVADI